MSVLIRTQRVREDLQYIWDQCQRVVERTITNLPAIIAQWKANGPPYIRGADLWWTYDALTTALATRYGIRVTTEDDPTPLPRCVRGQFDPKKREIYVRPMPRAYANEMVRVLLHEAAHALIYHRGNCLGSGTETHAELVAWIVGHHFGCDFSPMSAVIVANENAMDYKLDWVREPIIADAEVLVRTLVEAY